MNPRTPVGTAPPPAPNQFCIGLDLGRQVDPSALALLQWTLPRPDRSSGRIAPPTYEVPTLVRWPLGTPYRQVAERVVRFMGSPPLCGHYPVLVVDATGVGDAVYQSIFELMVKERCRGASVGVVITAGSAVTHDQSAPGRWRVAKKQLASILQVLLGSGRLLVAEALAEARTLRDELGAFTVKITENLNETFESWREKDHDDLVLAVALAAWAAESLHVFHPPPPPPPRPRYLVPW
jgi:hypothetical protein